MNNNKSVTEIQYRILNMMKWFNKFCIDNEITYYMVGGTMLGAARHQGFIPWDDDIDIGVPRKDYERLLEISKSLIREQSQYIVESRNDENNDFEYLYAKIYDTSTTLIENKRKQPKRGLYIDVFPLDGIGDSMEDAQKNFKAINTKLNLLAAKSCAIRKGRNGFKNAAVYIAGIVPSFIYNPNRLMKQIDLLCTSRAFDNCSYVGNLVGNWRTKELMPRNVFGTPRLYQFEDTEFFGVEKYDEYLTCVYKNWRMLPPKEKQKSDHDYVAIDLNKSYFE